MVKQWLPKRIELENEVVLVSHIQKAFDPIQCTAILFTRIQPVMIDCCCGEDRSYATIRTGIWDGDAIHSTSAKQMQRRRHDATSVTMADQRNWILRRNPVNELRHINPIEFGPTPESIDLYRRQ